jgi:hypothetical protein
LESPNRLFLLSVFDLGKYATTAGIVEKVEILTSGFVSTKMSSNNEMKDKSDVHGQNLTVCPSKSSKRLVLRITWVWWISRTCKESMCIKSAIVLQCLGEKNAFMFIGSL